MHSTPLDRNLATSTNALEALDAAEPTLEPVLRLLRVIQRRWWWPVCFALVAAIVAAWQVSRKPIVYRASSTLLLEGRPHVVDKVTAVTADQNSDPERFANSQVHVLTSERMAAQVAHHLGVPAGQLDAGVSVAIDRTSQLMTLSVDDLDPEKARTLVNAYTDVYVESTSRDQAGIASDAASFLGGESKTHRQRLESDERALYEFQRENGLPASNFEESHKIYASTLQTLHQQASASVASAIKLRAELEQLRAARGNRELRRRLALATGSEAWRELQTSYSTLVQQAAQLEVRYGAKHPKLIETQEALAAVGKALDHEVDQAEAGLEARLRGNGSEQAQLRSAIAVETQKAVVLRQKELDYNRLKRHLDEDRESYDLVAKRQKELEIQAAVKQSYVRRLDAATVARPMPRPITRAGVLGVLLGMVLGVLLAVGLDLLDDTIRSPLEAENKMRAPLLGVVSALGPLAEADAPQAERTRAEYIVTHPRSVVAEQCHSLSSTTFSLFLEQPPRSLAVVSAASRDGKTLTCVNLAAALAARGKRVLLIDTDLRRGRLHSLFGVPCAEGVYEVAIGKVEPEAAIRRTFIPGVDFISCGDVPEKVAPTRILELERLRTVVTALRASYDLVLFDTAPLPMVSDVLVMGDLVDGALGVFRAGQSSTRLSNATERQLGAGRINFLGWVLNGVSESELNSRYYRRYGYYGTYAAHTRPSAQRS